MTRRAAVLAATLIAAPLLAHAQGLRPRILGTVVGVDGTTLTVHGQDGQDVTVKLVPTTRYQELKRMSLNAIDKNSYLGISAKDGPDGKLVAIQVVIFPEAARGAGDGHRPWYPLPAGASGGAATTTSMTNGTVSAAPKVETTMTNGTVAATSAQEGSAPELTVTEKDGVEHVLVPPSASIVTFAPGTIADVVKGAPVSVTENPSGTEALSVSVGMDGVTPM